MTLTISLSAEMAEFIDSQVLSGTYGSATEVLSEALRLLKERDLHRAGASRELQAAWREGMAGGDFATPDFDDLKAEGRAQLARNHEQHP